MTSEFETSNSSERRGLSLSQKLRAMPIGVKFASAVVVTLGVLALMVGFGLSRFAKEQLVQAKLRSSEVVVDSVAETLAPALDFADGPAVTNCAERLSRTRDVSRVIVWNQDSSQPVFRVPAEAQSRAPLAEESRVGATEIFLTRLLENPLGQPVGKLEVAFTLGSEERYSQHLRRRILWSTGLLALAIAGLIIVIAHSAIVLPLRQLVAAMSQLRNGRQVIVDASARDEIGELANGFNEMAHAIQDREQNLSIERDKSHELLDNMRQAILVVGHDGVLLDARSRQAQELFGEGFAGIDICTLLCDESRPAIERQAFREWLDVAFGLGPEHWTEVSRLAPTEAVVVARDGDTHVLTIDARPIVLEGRLTRIMFLCTDVTEQRRFEKAAMAREAEHDRQMRVMRTLVAGGGLQLVATLRTIEERMHTCDTLLNVPALNLELVNEVFQHVHSIKGDASVFELELLVQAATELEMDLGNYRIEAEHGVAPSTSASAQPFRDGMSGLARAFNETCTMIAAASPLGEEVLDLVAVRRSDLLALRAVSVGADQEIRDAVSRTLAQHFGSLVQNLVLACARWAQRLSKTVITEVRGHDVLVPYELACVLPGVLTHLVRNCVSHGIEAPEARIAAGKPEAGRIELRCEIVDQKVEIHVIDDGQGLNEGLLLAQAGVAEGVVPPEEAVFEAGVSTADDKTILAGFAGRGIGLGSVRAELASVGYSVELVSFAGRGLAVKLHHSPNCRIKERLRT